MDGGAGLDGASSSILMSSTADYGMVLQYTPGACIDRDAIKERSEE